ncbi:MAG TPA: terminase family protein [Planctomycetota bacterium]|nr:terminase family protein [Planctomycetota bacterium]
MARRAAGYSRGALSPEAQRAEIKNWTISQLQFTHPQKAVRQALYEHNTVVMFGGNFSAKTFLGVEIAVEACLGGFSWCPTPANVMLVGLAAKEAREAFQEYIELFVPPGEIIRSTTREELTDVIRFRNGSKLVIRTAGQGRENFQGSRMHLIVFDEEPPWAIYKEARMRLRADSKLRILFTMTPLKGFTQVYKNLIQRKEKLNVAVVQASIFENGTPGCCTCGKTREQYEELLGGPNAIGTPDAWAQCRRCRGYGVEPRVSQEEVEEIELLYDGAEKMSRLYGEWGDLRANRIFTKEEIDVMRESCLPGSEGPDGSIIYEPPKPGRRYLCSVDTGEGRGNDETVITIIDAAAGTQVATWCNRHTSVEMAAAQVVDMANDYNRCKIWVEIPGPGYGMIECLKALGWTNFYEQRKYDHRRKMVVDNKIGWHSSPRGRDMILRNMIIGLRKGELTIRDIGLVNQLEMLAHNIEKKRLDVPDDYNDDRIFAFAGAREGVLAYYYSDYLPKKKLNAVDEWRRERLQHLQNARKDTAQHPYFRE